MCAPSTRLDFRQLAVCGMFSVMMSIVHSLELMTVYEALVQAETMSSRLSRRDT